MKKHLVLMLSLVLVFVLVGLMSRADEGVLLPSSENISYEIANQENPSQEFKAAMSSQLLRSDSNLFSKEKFKDFNWRLRLSYDSFEEDVDDSKNVSFKYNINGNYQLSPFFSLHLDSDISAKSGRAQSRFKKDKDPGININSVYLEGIPFYFMSGSAGIISQEDLGSKLLVDSKFSFPAWRVKFFKPDKVELRQKRSNSLKLNRESNYEPLVQLELQEALPTSQSSNLERTEKEEYPLLKTLKLSGNYYWGLNNSAKIFSTYYEYSHLPSKVASESLSLGNTVGGYDAANSYFIYEYQGLLYGLELKNQWLHNWGTEVSSQWIQNQKAPVGYNAGRWTRFKVNYQYYDMVLSPFYSQYFNESDTSPAYYGSALLGFNNRKGYQVGLDIQFQNSQYKVSGIYGEAEPININEGQDLLRYFTVSWEMHHDFF